MADEGTEVQPTKEPGSSTPEAQEVAPPAQPGAGAPAAEVSPTTEKGPEEQMVPLKRLAGLQSGFQKKFDAQDKLLQQRAQELEELRTQFREIQTKGMTDAEKVQFEIAEERKRLQREREELEDEKFEQEQLRAQYGWLAYYQQRGVPPEVLADCEDFQQMQDAVVSYYESRLAQQAASPPAAPSGAPGPADKVHTGAGGVAPSRDYDRAIAEGVRPGTKAWRELSRKIKRAKKIV